MPGRKKIRFGIIGCGLMGREFASAASRWCHLLEPEVEPEIVGLCSGHESSFDWFVKNFASVKQTTTDYRELLANPEIDAVYCAVPHNLHGEIYRAVLESGKHLFGEKPFGIDADANKAICDTAAAHPDSVVRCVSQFPFYPGPQRIIRMLENEEMGQILEVEAGFLHSSDLNPHKPINWKRIIAINGEYGCMGDLGMHVLHIPLRLGWFPQSVSAVLTNVVPQRPDAGGNKVPCETWDNANLLCRVEKDGGSFPMTLKTQRIAPGETNSWYISVKGTRNSAQFSTKTPRTLATMPYQIGREQNWRMEDLGYEPVYPTITGHIFEFGFGDAILQMMASYCDQVDRGDKAVLPFGCATLEETKQHQAVLTAALESQRNNSIVKPII